MQVLWIEPSKRKKVLYLWLFIVLGASTLSIALYLFRADTFSIAKIKPTRDFSFQATPSVSHKELQELKEIVSQPFTFLTEGPESYVFASQDNKHVIKFFKMRRMTPKYWLNYIPLPWLEKKRLSKIEERERVRHECFGGLKIASENFKQQTGIVFLHLFRTQYLKMKVAIQDDINKWHEVSLDQVPFLIQKKVSMFPQHLKSIMEEGNKEAAVRHLCQLLELMKATCQRGYAPVSEEIEVDYGFLEDKPVYVEALYAKLDDTFSPAKWTFKNVYELHEDLQSWVAAYYPELGAPFEEAAQDILSSLRED